MSPTPSPWLQRICGMSEPLTVPASSAPVPAARSSLPGPDRARTSAPVSWRWPALATVVIAAAALVPQTPLRDAETLRPATDMGLDVPLVFVVLSPVCRLL